jgi:hypothetical protein
MLQNKSIKCDFSNSTLSSHQTVMNQQKSLFLMLYKHCPRPLQFQDEHDSFQNYAHVKPPSPN